MAMAFWGLIILAAVPAPASETVPMIPPPQGLVVSGAVEMYNPGSLYEKINGQAELYLSAGFEGLKSWWYERVEDAGQLIEMNVYSMGSPLNAFSVYSQQQRQEAEKLNIAQFAYQSQSAVFLVHGAFYVEILPSEYSKAMTDYARQLAEQFIAATDVKDGFIKELEYFPAAHLDQGSITFIAKDAFGMNRLDSVFMATYQLDGQHLTAYLSERKSPEAAKQLVDAVHAHFMGFGGSDLTPDIRIAGARMVMVMDYYELMFSIGPYLVGIHEAGTRQQAEKIGELIYKSLQKRLYTSCPEYVPFNRKTARQLDYFFHHRHISRNLHG